MIRDGGSNHKWPPIWELLERSSRLQLERLPAYAPDLNPVELIRSHLKYGLMANFVPRHVEHLDQVVRENLTKLSRKPSLIRSLWMGSRLPFPQAKLAT